ncbi:cell division protein FtsB [Virgibacillus halotolerans]|nr:hypothetical protein [Virgibacillus halotolerans]MBM7600999.1 cell division protein FtsB [Virgibacillus halotolerans]
MSLTVTTIVVYLTLASLLFTIADITKIKKENAKLKEEIEIIKKQISSK